MNTQTQPAVSVVIIFLNAERFLQEAIESVCAQTCGDWELILADDGSNDRSTAIAREYENRFPDRVTYLDHPDHQNRGMSATRNAAVRRSRGKWIAFLDADDVWLPNKLEEQQRIVADHPEAGLLYGSPLYWFSWVSGKPPFPDCQPGIGVPAESMLYPPELMLRNYPLGTGPAPCPSDLIVSRAVYDRVGGFEESFGGIYQMYEDQAFLSKVYRSVPVYVSGRCWTRYRQHVDACTIATRDSGRYKEVRHFFLEYLERNLDEGETNAAVRDALRRAWWPYKHPALAGAAHLLRRASGRARRELSRAQRLFTKASAHKS
jgi:glycosyltransferase involved in cell wall biosynthesis